MAVTLQLRKIYSFSVYASQILSTDFQNVTVLSLLDYESAQASSDVRAMHGQIYSFLPPGTMADDPASYNYVKVRTDSGDTIILGIPWIKTDTIVEIRAGLQIVRIPNFSPDKLNQLRSALSQNGFSQFTLDPLE